MRNSILYIILLISTINSYSQLNNRKDELGNNYYTNYLDYSKQITLNNYYSHQYEYFQFNPNNTIICDNILSKCLNKDTYSKLIGSFVIITIETDINSNLLNIELSVPKNVEITYNEFLDVFNQLKTSELVRTIKLPTTKYTGSSFFWDIPVDCGYANDKKMLETTPPYYQRPYDTQYIAMPSGFETVDFTLYPMLSNAQKAQVKGAQVFMKFPHINGIQVIAVFVGSFITRTEYLVTIKDGEIIDKLLVGRRYKTDNGAFPIAQFDYLSKDGNIVVYQLNTTEKLVQTNFQEMNATMLKTYYKIDSQTGHFIQNDSTSFTTKKITCKQLLNARICNLFLH